MTHWDQDRAAHPEPVPVACDMTQAPDSVAERLQEYRRLLATAFLARERTHAGVRWRLRGGADIEAWARDLAARENACCAFMTTTITVTDGEVWWDATTGDDPAARAVLELFHDLPAARGADPGDLHDRFLRITRTGLAG